MLVVRLPAYASTNARPSALTALGLVAGEAQQRVERAQRGVGGERVAAELVPRSTPGASTTTRQLLRA